MGLQVSGACTGSQFRAGGCHVASLICETGADFGVVPQRRDEDSSLRVDLCGMTEHSAPVFGDKSIEGKVENKKHRDEETNFDSPPLTAPLDKMAPAAGPLARRTSSDLFDEDSASFWESVGRSFSGNRGSGNGPCPWTGKLKPKQTTFETVERCYFRRLALSPNN